MRWSEVAPRAWRLGPWPRVTVPADPDRLRAALDALLENAVKYTAERDAIELRARVDRPGGVLIEVEDEGSGVPAEALTRIFDRFARADAAPHARRPAASASGSPSSTRSPRATAAAVRSRSTARGSIFALHLPRFARRQPARARACRALSCIERRARRSARRSIRAPGEHRGGRDDARPARPDSKSRSTRAGPPRSAGRRRSARGPVRARALAPTGEDPRAGPDRRTASRASPRTGPGGRPPRRRRPPPTRGDGWSGRGSGGTPGAARAPPAWTRSAAQYGHSKSAYTIRPARRPAPRTWSSSGRLGNGRRAEVRQAAAPASRPSKIRLAPGSSPGDGA